MLGQHRSTQRKIPTTRGDEAALTADIDFGWQHAIESDLYDRVDANLIKLNVT